MPRPVSTNDLSMDEKTIPFGIVTDLTQCRCLMISPKASKEELDEIHSIVNGLVKLADAPLPDASELDWLTEVLGSTASTAKLGRFSFDETAGTSTDQDAARRLLACWERLGGAPREVSGSSWSLDCTPVRRLMDALKFRSSKSSGDK